ncbi:hypothetical protein [Caloranaerobacter ferrireducens]|uniref:hypothetical protein n=1 Tax=Caloranaerobacter ferrireducens TaxID=1323370 RepID=UPI00084DDD24|nr:hypothetical protein [Caloranaerobacter ferrireducens]
MWIRSQDKKMLIKANVIQVCSLDDEYTQIWGYVNEISEPQYNGFILGEYKTEERALEVLDDIQNRIKEGISIYEMPEK